MCEWQSPIDRNMNMKYIIAVDLGGTITKVGLLRNGELVDYVKMPSRQDLDMTASLPEIENAIDFLLNSNGVKRLFGVGIAFPGLVNNKKSIIISTNEKYDAGVFFDIFSEKLETIKVKKEYESRNCKAMSVRICTCQYPGVSPDIAIPACQKNRYR